MARSTPSASSMRMPAMVKEHADRGAYREGDQTDVMRDNLAEKRADTQEAPSETGGSQ